MDEEAQTANEQSQVLQQFIDTSVVFNLDESIILNTIELRKLYSIKLPDAIIAATALVNGLILITLNTKDFENIIGLKFIDPENKLSAFEK